MELNMLQVIIRNNDATIYQRIYASLGLDELIFILD